jgi:hypothetical protein
VQTGRHRAKVVIEYVKGDTVTVSEHLAQEWERSGYVERVTSKT